MKIQITEGGWWRIEIQKCSMLFANHFLLLVDTNQIESNGITPSKRAAKSLASFVHGQVVKMKKK